MKCGWFCPAPVRGPETRRHPEGDSRQQAIGARVRVNAVLSAVLAALMVLALPIDAGEGQAGPDQAGHGQAAEGAKERLLAQILEDEPARLSAERAQKIYDLLRTEEYRIVSAAHAVGAGGFTQWRRYNSAPYLSEAHGNSYVNNYVNEAGRAYGRFEKAGALPVGTVIAKDSFVVSSDRSYQLGQLLVMEKMPAGFNPASGDWRYSMISPRGEVIGITNGQNPDQVSYCVPCHLSRQATDHLFFPPEEFRAATE